MSQPQPALSLVIPIFNEVKRIHKMFEVLDEFSRLWGSPLQIILVDDGSTDQSKDLISAHLKELPKSQSTNYELISYPKNSGKGFAVKTGVQSVSHHYFLTLDADMAAKPNNLLDWFAQTPIEPSTIYIGSREHQRSIVKDKTIRRLAGRAFNMVARWWSGLPYLDTQCGFKWYPTPEGIFLFSQAKSARWEQDVEILQLAALLKIPVCEKPVQWDYQPFSKVKLFRDGFRTILQLILLRVDLKKRKKAIMEAFFLMKKVNQK